MVDGCLEEDSGRHIRVCGRKVEGELEGEAGVGSIVRAGDCSGPQEQIIRIVWESRDTGRGGHHELHQFGLEPDIRGQ